MSRPAWRRITYDSGTITATTDNGTSTEAMPATEAISPIAARLAVIAPSSRTLLVDQLCLFLERAQLARVIQLVADVPQRRQNPLRPDDVRVVVDQRVLVRQAHRHPGPRRTCGPGPSRSSRCTASSAAPRSAPECARALPPWTDPHLPSDVIGLDPPTPSRWPRPSAGAAHTPRGPCPRPGMPPSGASHRPAARGL